MYPTPRQLAEFDARQQALAPYFGLGFCKVTLDPTIFKKIRNCFSENKDRIGREGEVDYIGTTKKNYSPTLLIHDQEFNDRLLEELKPLHEEWSGMKLRGTACYGIRVYQPGSYLFTHVDRIETHHISSTICVAHALKNPWPLYIEDIDGHPHEISMEPGEMVFYEGAKLMHGRPYPLDGRFYAGIFVHYTPAT